MKKLLFALLLFFLVPGFVFAQSEFTDEHIKDFNSIININKDGSISVTEKILYDFSNLDKHGIFRNIPFTKRDESGKRVDLTFENFVVQDENGKSYKFDKYNEGKQIVLKIGNPDKTITGVHTYIITYEVKGAVGYFENQDELYWNITGTEWNVPISTSSAAITLPENISNESFRSKCFTGSYGSEGSNCSSFVEGNSVHFFTTSPLNAYEGLTTVAGFPKNTVAYLPPTLYVSFWEKPLGILIIVLIIFVGFVWYFVLPIYLIIEWIRRGRDPNVGVPVRAWYDPPKTKSGRDLTPAETGALLDEHVNRRDIFAAIVDLARRGHLIIEEKKKEDFYLNGAKSKETGVLLDFEKDLLDGIFKSGEKVHLKDVKLYKIVQDAESKLYDGLVLNGFFTKSPRATRNIYYAIGGAALFTFNWVLALVSFIFGRVMPRKTLFGAQQANVARGMKNFLVSQERQIKFQADKQMMFEKLLPFAVAFGAEKIWAKRFEKFDLKEPDWYRGYSGGGFNSVIFMSSLNNSMGSFTVSSTPPSSSSRSGFSSGGGFSGGGGGGGGGGSW